MQAGLAVVSLRYVAEQTQHFALLSDGNRTVAFGSGIEPPDLSAFERSDCRDRCRVDRLRIRKSRHSRESLFTLIQDQDECPAVVLGGQLGSHEPSRRNASTAPAFSNRGKSARSTPGECPGSSRYWSFTPNPQAPMHAQENRRDAPCSGPRLPHAFEVMPRDIRPANTQSAVREPR